MFSTVEWSATRHISCWMVDSVGHNTLLIDIQACRFRCLLDIVPVRACGPETVQTCRKSNPGELTTGESRSSSSDLGKCLFCDRALFSQAAKA